MTARSANLPGWSDSDGPATPSFWRWAWESTYPVLGYVLVGLGLIALAVGWYGVSGTAVVAKQVPYLASGGLLGIGLVALGGRFLLIQDLRRDSGRLDRLETMVLELHAALLSRSDAPAPAQRTAAAGETDRVTVLNGGQTYHRPDCRMLEGKNGARRLRPTVAAKRGLTPCPLCEPLPAHAAV